jgi:hypothetical protein
MTAALITVCCLIGKHTESILFLIQTANDMLFIFDLPGDQLAPQKINKNYPNYVSEILKD